MDNKHLRERVVPTILRGEALAALCYTSLAGAQSNSDAEMDKRGKWSFDTEGLQMEFPDNPNNTHLDVKRAELTGDAVDAIDGNEILALTIGTNLWFNPATRLQINAIAEQVDGNGNGAFTGGDRIRPTLLTELQIKF